MTPDWHDPKQYPDPADTSLHRWAWEFLRRNPKFEAEAGPASKKNMRMKKVGTLPKSWSVTPFGRVLKKWRIVDPNVGELRQSVRGHSAPIFDCGPWPVEAPRAATSAIRYRIEFDLTAPIEPQLQRAKGMLETQQRFHLPTFRRKRTRADQFALYLRILDAIDAKATEAQIVETMTMERVDNFDDRALQYWTKRAVELRDGGYRELLSQ